MRDDRLSGGGRIGLVGVGAMGRPIGEALLAAGHELAVFDPRPEAIAPLVERGALSCGSPAGVAEAAPTLFTSLPTPDVLREVVSAEDGLIGRTGTALATVVDLSTVGAACASEVATALGAAGVAYLDAPVSGGVAGAKAGTLAVMASGDRDVFMRMRSLLETFGESVFWIGPDPGQGQIAKLLNNLLSATAVAVTAEAVAFGVRAGLDPETLLKVFDAGSGRNTATAVKFPKHVLTRGFGAGFRLRMMAKDLDLCLEEVRARNAPMPLGGLVQQLWTVAAAMTEEGADHTEFVRMYEAWNAVVVRASTSAPPEEPPTDLARD